LFFHIVIENKSAHAIDLDWVQFDLTNSKGVLLSGQYSGTALSNFSTVQSTESVSNRRRSRPEDRRRQRKAISDIFMDLPKGFIGENLVVEVSYKSGGKTIQRNSIQLSTENLFGRLPFDGTWYVAAEHGYLDPHKRFHTETFAYDFLQTGPNGKSYSATAGATPTIRLRKKVLAVKNGTVVSVRGDMAENIPGETRNVEAPGGNVVVFDHGNNQFGYYAHLKPFHRRRQSRCVW
jgi:murein DD-endopeptidase MepM/ murein hydrolase activator NlpD